MTDMPEMPDIEWSDDLLTGDREIDNQHKAFFIKAQRVLIACDMGNAAEEIIGTLKFMREYAKIHLSYEEKLMQETGYPYFETHKAEHASFLIRLANLDREFKNTDDKVSVAKHVAITAAAWFSRHIKIVDRPFIEYLQESRSSSSNG